MNQPAIKEDIDWTNGSEDSAQARVMQAWVESNDAPGKYLIQLRELQNKTVKDMAMELGLSVSQLDALENDKKDELPAPIYVKNYIKRYCTCLGMSEKEVSNILESISKEVLPALNRVSIKHNSNPRQAIMQWLGYILIAFVVALFLYGIKSIDLSGMWNSISSSSTTVESAATELSLPVISEEAVSGKKENK